MWELWVFLRFQIPKPAENYVIQYSEGSRSSDMESESSQNTPPAETRPSGWVRVGLVAAASALAGGLAAAWYYRKTLDRLHQAEAHVPEARQDETDPEFDT
jgi:hypothetical protein